jgi:hypothetical protein
VDDEDEAIALHREIVSLRPPEHVGHHNALASLANMLSTRYGRTGSLNDGDESVQIYKQIRQNHGFKGEGGIHQHTLYSYAGLLLTRHRLTGSHADLDDAILVYSECLGKDNKHQSGILHDAGRALMSRFRISKDCADLVKAIERFEASLNLRPSGHVLRYATLHDLAIALQTKYRILRCLKDVDMTMELQTMAQNCTPAGHPERSHVLFGLSSLYASSDSPYYNVLLALKYAGEALRNDSFSPYSRVTEFSEALPHIEPLAFNNDADIKLQVFEMFRSALYLLPHIANYGLDLREQLRVLKGTEHLATLGADAALRLGKVQDAVEVLEAGRGVLVPALAAQDRLRRTPVGALKRASCLGSPARADHSSIWRTETRGLRK